MNKRIEIIDNKLSLLLKIMNHKSYVSFIKCNKHLRIYDTILGRIDVNHYPKYYKLILTRNFLNKVEQIVDDKIKDLGLTHS